MERLSELCEIFPDLENILAPSSTVEAAINQGIIVLDANTLLLPYGVSENSFADIKSVYTELASKNRLIIPAHAIREFLMNRGCKFSDMRNYFSQTQNEINSKNISISKYPFLSEEFEYKEIFRIISEIKKLKNELFKQFSLLLPKIDVHARQDYVLSAYNEIFTKDTICSSEISKEQFDRDLKRRQQFNIPPGYKDKSKDINSGGDLIIWHTILEIGKAKKKDLIFVSQETKPDWCYSVAKKPFLPRVELLDEYRRASDGKSLFIIPLSELLSLLNANPRTIADLEIQQLAQTSRSRAKAVSSFSSIDDRIQNMLAWFYANYERPENSLPYEGKEGGFFYIWGGPYDAKEVLWEQFGGEVSEKEIDLCVEKIEDEHGYIEWSKISYGEPFLWVKIYPDWETGERCGAGGTFQVSSIEDEDGKDYTKFIDQGVHYRSTKEVLSDLSKAIGVNVDGDLQE